MHRLFLQHPKLLAAIGVFILANAPLFVYAQTGPIENGIYDVLWLFVNGLFGLLVYLGGSILDVAIDEFVLGFGGAYLNSGVGVAVDNTWIIIRDFVNLFFIFGLVYIGFKMILGSDDSNTRRWLVNLIIAALLINFSLFITKFVVDFSNQLSAEIAVAGLGADQDSDGRYRSDVSEQLLNHMGLSNIWSTERPPAAGFGYIFGAAILFLVTAFVFAAGGILLIIRFAVLNLYLVLSAVMFVSWVLPFLSDTMEKYWRGFVRQCFFAPIYLLFIYFSFQIIGGLQTVIGNGQALANPQYGAVFSGNPDQAITGALGTLPYFVLICVFMIASLVIAQKMGAEGADKMVKFGKSISQRASNAAKKGAGSATFGMTARFAQGTVGAAAAAATNSQGFQRLAARSRLGRMALSATDKVADASFDARRLGGLGKELGIGEGKKGGFKTRVKEQVKKDEEFIEKLKEADMDDPRNIEKAKKRQGEIESRAKKEADEAAVLHEQFEKDRKKTEVQLTREIEDLKKTISINTAELAKHQANGTRTPQEIAAMERRLENERGFLNQKENIRVEVNQKDFARDAIEKNKKAAFDPSLSVTEREKAQTELRTAETQLAETITAIDQQGRSLQRRIAQANADMRGAAATANAEVKFASRIAFLDSARRNAEATFTTQAEKASFKNLKKKLGATAAEMAKKSKEKDDEDKILKKIKELTKDDDKEKGKKEKDDDDE